jgi:hypothetical protein
LEGVYRPDEKRVWGFTAIKGAPNIVLLIISIPRVRVDILSVTVSSFEHFKQQVLDKNVEWKKAEMRIMGDDQKEQYVEEDLPGTWESNKGIVDSYNGGKSKRNRISSRRRPTKRRRSRRNLNRKTKKN